MDRFKEFASWWTGTVYHKEQLDLMLSSLDIYGYAYILHDKCVSAETGKLKKPHYHFLIKFARNLRGSWFKRYWSDEFGKIMPDPVSIPKSIFDYLIHATPIAQKQGKYQYDSSERISTLDSFEGDEKEKVPKITREQMRKLIAEEGLTPRRLNLAYIMSKQQREEAEDYFIDFHSDRVQYAPRKEIECIYIYGKPRVGKTTYVWENNDPKKLCRFSQYKHHPYDSYEFQSIAVFDEYNSQIDIGFMNNLTDTWMCELPCRYRNKHAAWDTVYVISNIALEDQYKKQSANDEEIAKQVDAFRKRFHKVYRLDKNGDVRELVLIEEDGKRQIIPADKIEPLSKAEQQKFNEVFGF